MRMTAEEAFVKVLQRHGIEHVFGIIGSAFMPISDLFPKDDLVLNGRDAKRSCAAIRLWDIHPPRWRRPVRPRVHAVVKVGETAFQPFRVHPPRHAIRACRRVLLQLEERPAQRIHRNVVEERRETHLTFPLYNLPYPVGRL